MASWAMHHHQRNNRACLCVKHLHFSVRIKRIFAQRDTKHQVALVWVDEWIRQFWTEPQSLVKFQDRSMAHDRVIPSCRCSVDFDLRHGVVLVGRRSYVIHFPCKIQGVKLAPKQQVGVWLSISDCAMLFSTMDSCVEGRCSSLVTTRQLLEDTLQTLAGRIWGAFQCPW